MAILYKRKNKKTSNEKNGLSEFDKKLNHRTHEFKLKKVPFIQTK
jgi:hypothetical protein